MKQRVDSSVNHAVTELVECLYNIQEAQVGLI